MEENIKKGGRPKGSKDSKPRKEGTGIYIRKTKPKGRPSIALNVEKYLLILPDWLFNYVADAANKQKLNKAEYIRQLIINDMIKNNQPKNGN
jgi:hypothetical protein